MAWDLSTILLKHYSLIKKIKYNSRNNTASIVHITEDVGGDRFAREHDIDSRRRCFHRPQRNTKPRSRSQQTVED